MTVVRSLRLLQRNTTTVGPDRVFRKRLIPRCHPVSPVCSITTRAVQQSGSDSLHERDHTKEADSGLSGLLIDAHSGQVVKIPCVVVLHQRYQQQLDQHSFSDTGPDRMSRPFGWGGGGEAAASGLVV